MPRTKQAIPKRAIHGDVSQIEEVEEIGTKKRKLRQVSPLWDMSAPTVLLLILRPHPTVLSLMIPYTNRRQNNQVSFTKKCCASSTCRSRRSFLRNLCCSHAFACCQFGIQGMSCAFIVTVIW